MPRIFYDDPLFDGFPERNIETKPSEHFTVVAFREGMPLDTGEINAIDQLEMSGYVSIVPPFYAPDPGIVKDIVKDVSCHHSKHVLGVKGGESIERTSGKYDGMRLWPTRDCESEKMGKLRQHLVTFLRYNEAEIFDSLPPTPYYVGFRTPESLCVSVGNLTVMKTCMEFYEVIGRYELDS